MAINVLFMASPLFMKAQDRENSLPVHKVPYPALINERGCHIWRRMLTQALSFCSAQSGAILPFRARENDEEHGDGIGNGGRRYFADLLPADDAIAEPPRQSRIVRPQPLGGRRQLCRRDGGGAGDQRRRFCGQRVHFDLPQWSFLESFQCESAISLESLEKTVFSFASRRGHQYLMGSASSMGPPYL
jgi:hypothetical protein